MKRYLTKNEVIICLRSRLRFLDECIKEYRKDFEFGIEIFDSIQKNSKKEKRMIEGFLKEYEKLLQKG